MQRVYNFAAGPAALPLPVLEKVKEELLSYGQAGCSVMEMSHRSKSFQEIADRAETALRRLMGIGDDYAVLFLQGGASLQFSMLAMNLAARGDRADYALSGNFAEKAYEEGLRWCEANIAASTKEDSYKGVPELSAASLSEGSKYLHLTANNTIYGTMYPEIPKGLPAPLVCDMSSIILGREYDIKDFALIYAGAQKNLGPAGLTIVIIRRDMIRDDLEDSIPTMLRYRTFEKSGSMYNTPPCFSIYVAGLVFEWVESEGGVKEMERRNREKAALLYETIDASSLFAGTAASASRSIMNVCFTLPGEELTSEFLKFAGERGLCSIKGHRAVGGCRASIYNAMPLEGVKALADCMKEFETKKA
ncbi:MAG: 3-phosphoserine/phosphohydroxythreonine transaminase [Oscillospiraceae bacterium]|nr:3-phosphoserine/phosphohydroxythreonine transaminase [Oscillospiraceae bacterium]